MVKLVAFRGETAMKQLLVLGVAALALAACDGKPGINGMQATQQGVYYRNLWGRLYRIEGDKLIPVSAPSEASPRNLDILQTIPASDTGVGFPAKVTGTVRLEGDVQKIKLSLSLVANGQKQPSSDDQTNFANALVDGKGGIVGLTLRYSDGDGFSAMDPKGIIFQDNSWTRITDDNGKVSSLEWLTRDTVDPRQAKGISTVAALWSTNSAPVAGSYPDTPATAAPDPTNSSETSTGNAEDAPATQ
jgi:hypothetical protein